MAFHKYRTPPKSFARKLGRRVFRKATGPVRRTLKRWDRANNRRYYKRRGY